MHTIIMPKMGDAMEEGTLVRWLKAEGESVKEGEPIAEIATDKATIEIEAPGSGVLKGIRVQEGQIVPISTPLAYILAEGESLPTESTDGKPPAKTEGSPAPAPPPSPAPTAIADKGTPSRVKASPLARKIAEEHKVDLSLITGTGPQGRIVERDVLAYLEAQKSAVPSAPAPAPTPTPPAPPAPTPISAGERAEPLNRLRQISAQRTTEAKQTIPHFYLTMEIDMENALAFRAQVNQADESVKVSVNDLIVKACAVALERYPVAHARYEGNQIVYPSGAHIGIAVAVEEGLLVAVVRHCEQKSLRRIAQESQTLVQKAREGKLLPDEMTGNTFTVSNLGMFGIEEFAAIINPPAPAILAVGAVKKVPVVLEDGTIVPRAQMKVTLSCDHRVLDGATGARFLQELKRVLENPVLMV
ncbi:MAG: dihydrolipoamide acetyltransferase family protein [Fimbriimonadales bacterium]